MPRDLIQYRCPNGHAFLYRHDRCAHCDAGLQAVATPATATLLSHTVLRVSPTGEPFVLGIAEAQGGARTLCIVEGEVTGDGAERVELYLEGDVYHARIL